MAYLTGFEFELIRVLRAIVAETMAYPPVRPSSAESYLPSELITQAQDALKLYGLHIDPNPEMMVSGDDLVTSQPLQPCGVRSPGSVGISGHTPIVVQVYALGRGVSVVTERGNLSGRESAFELEANGKIFVFDPVNAGQAYGFVTPVEGDVPSIRLQLQAVDQEHLAKFGDGISHGNNSQKTVILSLPSGFGKTTMATALLDKIGCQEIDDDWCPLHPLKPGALHLTNQPFSTWWITGETAWA